MLKASLFNKVILLMLFTILVFSCQQHNQNTTFEEGSNPTSRTVDLVVHNANIYTSNRQQPWAEAMVINNGKFIYVGNNSAALEYKAAATINFDGRLVIPGMVDGHAHPGYVNVENFIWVEGSTPEALLASVKQQAEKRPDEKWLRMCCWPTDMFVNGSKGPKKDLLDEILPDRLVWFESATAHDYWLNSKALAELGIDKNTPDPKPGLAMFARDEHGEPTGWLKEGAGVQYFAEHFALVDEERIKLHEQSVIETLEVLSKHGITALFDAGNKGFGDHVYSLISRLENEGKLPLRYYGTYQIFTPERAKTAISEIKRYREQYGSDLLQFNSVKLFMDGITANQSASYINPYAGTNKSVEPMLSTDELSELLVNLHHEKLDLMIHSIGDQSTRTILDAVELAHAEINEAFYPRITIAHLTLINHSDIPRLRELGIIANFTPWWFGVWKNEIAEKLLGEDRYNNMYRAKTVFESGALVTFSSDEWWGGEMLSTYVSPYLGMQVGHTRQNPKDWWETENDGVRAPNDERLKLEQLLEGYTINGAFQLRMENELGSIETGKTADFLLFNQSLFEIAPHQIYQIQPVAVVVNGEVMQCSLVNE